MKNRCIIIKNPDNITNFICLGENDSVIATNTARGIMLQFLHNDRSFILKAFSVNESEIKDRFYDRLCFFLQYGEASVLNSKGDPCTVNTFDVEQQVKEIKKGLKYEL